MFSCALFIAQTVAALYWFYPTSDLNVFMASSPPKPTLKKGEDGLTKYQRYYKRYIIYFVTATILILNTDIPKLKRRIVFENANVARNRKYGASTLPCL